MQAYCLKYRKKVQAKNTTQVTLKNGRLATRGTCPNCSITVYRIGKG